MGQHRQSSDAMIYYAGCRVKFERIDREGLTGSLASLPSMSLAIFISR
jgi:hypothetical protein